jgi:hypothetical protein
LSPPLTPESLIRDVMQGLQGALETGANQETIPVPRSWLQSWLDTLGVVLALAGDHLTPGAVVMFVTVGALGILAGLALCWLIC